MSQNNNQVNQPVLPPVGSNTENQNGMPATVEQRKPDNGPSLSRCPRMKFSWCGFGSLQSGVKIVGFVSLFGNMIACAIQSYFTFRWLLNVLFEIFGGSNMSYDWRIVAAASFVGTIFLSLIVVISSMFLLYGAFRARQLFLIPWLISDMFLRCIHVCSLAYSSAAYSTVTFYVVPYSSTRFRGFELDRLSDLILWNDVFIPPSPFWPSPPPSPPPHQSEATKQILQPILDLSTTTTREGGDVEIVVIVYCSIAIVVGTYFWCIVLSYFLEIEEIEKRRMDLLMTNRPTSDEMYPV